jgi:hypothetical protein
MIGGVPTRNLDLFQSLCGDNPLKSVVVVTTMWGLLPPNSLAIGQEREKEMKTNPGFFEPIIKQGGRLKRHYDTIESAQQIISSLLSAKHKREALAIQSEIVDDGLRLDQTTAAIELTREFDEVIENLKTRIEKEKRAMASESSRERKRREEAIQRMNARMQDLEDRKVKIRKNPASLWLHRSFLRWVKAMFS